MARLDRYRDKRDFARTPEPRPEAPSSAVGTGRRYVIQKHAARRLHYDLRLEHDGVLRSWAVPRGPSLDPRERRLAVPTEDHPLDYADFEGVIPRGQYGAGGVIVWDRGTWTPTGDVDEDLRRGRLGFILSGEKLRGGWNLVRTNDERWLLIKARDEFAREREADAEPILETRPDSVVSGRRIEDLGATGSPTRPVEPTDTPDVVASLEDLHALPGATPIDALPPSLSPQLARDVDDAPTGEGWLHEIKLDGYRLLAHVDHEQARLLTRTGLDWSARAPSLCQVFAQAGLGPSVFDGELCVFDEVDGRSSFAALQQALADNREDKLAYVLFDLPILDGWDLRQVPLRARKQLLRELIAVHFGAEAALRYGKDIAGDGPEVFARACELGLEGIISKRHDAPYVSKRTDTWRKIKCPQRTTVVVGGYAASDARDRPFASLLVGNFDDEGQFHYRGKVGSGYSQRELAAIHARLYPLERSTPPFVDPPGRDEISPWNAKRARTEAEGRVRAVSTGVKTIPKGGVTWVEPELRISVVYSDVTDAGRLRHPRFQRLDEPQPPSRLRLTHPDKLLDADPPLRKRDYADYVMEVSAWLLPHIVNRPLSLVRCPEGVGGACFFQRHRMRGAPEAIGSVRVEEPGGEAQIYACVVDALGLVGLVQISALEFHVWGSRRDQLERPDRLVFDLDPDRELDWARVVEAAFEVRERLAALGLRSFVKTTGGKGLHVVVPIEPRYEFPDCKRLTKALAMRMALDSPGRYTATPSKDARAGKIFVDYIRNGRGATSVAPYSPRARPGVPVSTPLTWDELPALPSSDVFTIHNLIDRLRTLTADPWDDLLSLRQTPSPAMFRALGLDAPNQL